MSDEVKIDYKELAQQLLVATKAPSGTPTNVNAHGAGGLFSPFGLSRDIVNAMLFPGTGLINRLPWETSNEENPLLGILTGLTASSGSEQSNRCDDPPSAGLVLGSGSAELFVAVAATTFASAALGLLISACVSTSSVPPCSAARFPPAL